MMIEQLGIQFPIFKTYKFEDKKGLHYLVLTERIYKQSKTMPYNDSIKAYCYLMVKGKPELEWSMRDFIMKPNKSDSDETSIWFWSKYFDIKDFDQDGYVDPVIIYGTSGDNGTDDGRIKILIYYHNVKYGVRHQNGTLDFQRHTKIDENYYTLPVKIQDYVPEVMHKMEENDHAIFPAGYE
ncbi:MAG: hypothetical protein C0594_08915, partial [Marinilabiliales bacterium]